MRRGRLAMFAALLMGAIAALTVTAPSRAEAPGEGMLQAMDKEGQPLGLCPLKHTDVRTDITGYTARVTLTQEFGNPFEKPIEAIYTFPMSERAAVDRMTMKIGDRVIKGVVKERGEARRIYEAAKNAGQAASLLDQERPNIFTQSVANIMPGDRIEITISYVEYLQYKDGEYEFSFPMVVGPRYIPGTPVASPDNVKPDVMLGQKPGPDSTDQVPDSGRITPPITPEGIRAGHDISLEVHLNAGVVIKGLESVLHEVDVERPSESAAVVRLKDLKTIPNRDFVLKYVVAGDSIEDAVLTHVSGKKGHFTLIMQPPKRVKPEEIAPKELVFVIDSSGSMQGFPIEKAKKSMRMSIEGMNPNDTFNLMTFAGGTMLCFPKPVPNTAENRQVALQFLDSLQGHGGTEMMKAITGALADQNDPERLRIVCFMTDGYVGNDMEILDAIQKNRQTARVFSFGIGNSVNRYLIEGMARAGRGEAEIVTLESEGEEAAKRFHERISSPLLTDITVDFGDLDVQDVYPEPGAPPDLFAAEPLVLKGRYNGGGKGVITVRGKTAAGDFERKIEVTFPDSQPANDVLAPLWARERIEWLMNKDLTGIQRQTPDDKVKEEITKLGIEFGLVTQYTSFVAVEEKVINEGGKPQTVEVPVEMPDGVSYDGIFGEDSAAVTLGIQRSAAAKSMPMPCVSAMPESKPGVAAAPPVYCELAPMGSASARSRSGNEECDWQSSDEANDTEQVREDKAEEHSGEAGHSKLAEALRGLKDKLTDGNYADGAVKVEDGWVEVFVHLDGLSAENLKALKDLGVKIVAQRHSGNIVLAKVKVDDLEKVADLAFVRKVSPPTY